MKKRHDIGRWFLSRDGEDYIGRGWGTREEAVIAAHTELRSNLSPGEKFWTGLAVAPVSALNAASVVAMLDDHAYNDGPEGTDGYDVSKEAEAELDALLSAWAEKHDVWPQWFTVEEVREHVMPGASVGSGL